MPRYRRLTTTDCPVFFTVCLAQRGSTALIDHLDILRKAVSVTRRDRPFEILAWVVLHDHMHAVWRLPEGDPDYSQRWGRIKARFSRDWRRLSADCRPGLGPGPDAPPTSFPFVPSGRFAGLKPGLRVDKREQPIWQRRFWEHHCRDQRDVNRHIRYCWMNPVKHGLVDDPTEWAPSSIHRDIRNGLAKPGALLDISDARFGEAA